MDQPRPRGGMKRGGYQQHTGMNRGGMQQHTGTLTRHPAMMMRGFMSPPLMKQARREKSPEDDVLERYRHRPYVLDYKSDTEYMSGTGWKSSVQVRDDNTDRQDHRSRMVDCYILLTSASLRSYGITIERRLIHSGLKTEILYVEDENKIPSLLDDLIDTEVLFVVLIKPEHEKNESVTLGLLQGQIQEHRNMPVESAVSLIGKNFERIMQDYRNKYKSSGKPSDNERLPLEKVLELLLDSRYITLSEIQLVLDYLEMIRLKLHRKEGKPYQLVSVDIRDHLMDIIDDLTDLEQCPTVQIIETCLGLREVLSSVLTTDQMLYYNSWQPRAQYVLDRWYSGLSVAPLPPFPPYEEGVWNKPRQEEYEQQSYSSYQDEVPQQDEWAGGGQEQWDGERQWDGETVEEKQTNVEVSENKNVSEGILVGDKKIQLTAEAEAALQMLLNMKTMPTIPQPPSTSSS